MISYSQNYEDVILQRVLQNVTDGFYIDVGAAHPVFDSVTCYFYNSGWSGINIEPLKKNFDMLQSMRTRDINLCLAVTDIEGDSMFFESEIVGWSTLLPEIAEKHSTLANVPYEVIHVTTSTLNQICRSHVNKREIHFLKIDVEGAEKRVLLGFDLTKYRPWVIVIEATLPNSKIEVFGDWEFLVTSKNYKHVYSDGLNRFYLADEHSYLEKFFDYPPNVFDNFIQHNSEEVRLLEELKFLQEIIDKIFDSKVYKTLLKLRILKNYLR